MHLLDINGDRYDTSGNCKILFNDLCRIDLSSTCLWFTWRTFVGEKRRLFEALRLQLVISSTPFIISLGCQYCWFNLRTGNTQLSNVWEFVLFLYFSKCYLVSCSDEDHTFRPRSLVSWIVLNTNIDISPLIVEENFCSKYDEFNPSNEGIKAYTPAWEWVWIYILEENFKKINLIIIKSILTVGSGKVHPVSIADSRCLAYNYYNYCIKLNCADFTTFGLRGLWSEYCRTGFLFWGVEWHELYAGPTPDITNTLPRNNEISSAFWKDREQKP